MTIAATRHRVAYIQAASHSGSTLLAMLLNSHPEVCTVGELKITALGDVARYRCSCGALILECPFWSGVTADMRAAGFDFDIGHPGTHFAAIRSAPAQRLLRPLHRGAAFEGLRDLALACTPGWRGFLAATQARNAALIGSVLARSGKNVIVDSSKIGMRLKFLLRNPSLDVRVVRVKRDGRAVALTYMDPEHFADASNPALRGGGSGASRDAERLAAASAAREWLRSNEEAEAVLAGIEPGRRLEVSYEGLCRDTEGTLRRIFTFLGVDAGRERPPFRAAVHHVIGNGMRLDSSSEVRLDERWRQALSAQDLQTFDAVAGRMNRRLGYS
jgi:hypothetical protein